MANQNYLIYPNPDFTPTVDRLPDGTLVAYDAETQLWATFDTGLVFRKNDDHTWTQEHPCGCTPIVRQPNRHSQYPLIWRGSTTITIHVIVARAWIGSIPDGWHVDHIDGNKFNAAVLNLRILPAWLNHRDGGFVKKLRNKKIDPTHFSAPFLLRYFDRMADFKRSHTSTQYTRLTHDDLLRMLEC
ncbi:MAG: HNH endonuclease [Paludibacteraceae bacterium]|nr:HNH endonuclease [Paludibacteraceae bacterium]MBR6018046.1 HNH endonuclease [Paludibacteraceae bacterium]